MEIVLPLDSPGWDHATNTMSTHLTSKDWDLHRPTIERLYSVDKHSLKTVRGIMADRYGFYATERMFKSRLHNWKVRKNCTQKEMVNIIRITNDRAQMGKNTTFRVRGTVVDATKLRKFRTRKRQVTHDLLTNASTRASTPSDVSYNTPQDSPKPPHIGDGDHEQQISRRSSAPASFDILDMPDLEFPPVQINQEHFAEYFMNDLNDPRTLLAQEMSNITKSYFEFYFKSQKWTLYSMQSVNGEGDEIVDFTIPEPTSTIDANTSVVDFNNPGTLVTLYEVACLLLQRDNPDSAQRMIDQAQSLIQTFLENEHPQLLSSIFLVICILEAKGQIQLVVELLDFAYTKASTVWGPMHPISRMISCCQRASTSYQVGTPFVMESLVATFERLIGQDHTFTLRLKQSFAWSLLQQDRLDTALDELQKVHKRYRELAGDDHLHSRHALFEIGQIHTAQGDLKKAEEVFTRVMRLAEIKFGRDPPLMLNLECMRMLAVIYRRQDNHEKVLSTLCHTLPLGIKVLGKEHPTILLIQNDLRRMLE